MENEELENKKDKKSKKEDKPIEGVVMDNLTKAERTRISLSKQPTTTLFVPKEEKELDGVTLPVIVNGVRYNVPKGVYVDNVPVQVAEIVKESMNLTNKAFSDAKDKLSRTVKMEFDNSK